MNTSSPRIKFGYRIIEHYDSRRKRDRLQKPFQYSAQVVRHIGFDAIDLPQGVNKAVARYARGKYPIPFIGKKHEARIQAAR